MKRSRRKLSFWEECQAFVFGGLGKGLLRTASRQAGTITRFAEVLVEPKIEKWTRKMKPLPGTRVPRFPTAALRPFKYKDGISEEMLESDNVVIARKIRGCGVEATAKKGRFTKIVFTKGEKRDLLDSLPELRDAVLPEAIANGKFFFEIRAKGGEAFTNGLLHSTKENAAITIEKHGHPEVFVLAVHKLNGHDTSKLAFDEMRGLCDLVAKKIPHGKVPEIATTTDAKRALKEAVWKENEVEDPEPECDGIVAMSKSEPSKGMKVFRDKPLKSYDLIVMGFEDSKAEKFKGKGVASLIVGDGVKKLGKVNVAREDLRIAIKQNPDRWLNKVVRIVGERQTKTGAILKPRLKGDDSLPDLDPEKYYIRWDLDPKDVKPFDPDAAAAKKPEMATVT
jgi:hypothetical protein